MDRKRMENGSFIGKDYLKKLLEEIREIRLSERRFYQKITDIYATSIDYDKDSPLTRKFLQKPIRMDYFYRILWGNVLKCF